MSAFVVLGVIASATLCDPRNRPNFRGVEGFEAVATDDGKWGGLSLSRGVFGAGDDDSSCDLVIGMEGIGEDEDG